MKSRSLIYNANILTQDRRLAVDSMAIERGRIVAVGDNLRGVGPFAGFDRIDLRRRTVVPGFVDAHTHFYYYALSLGRIDLHGVDSLDECLRLIRGFCRGLGPDDWVVGEGYRPDLFAGRVEPDRRQLDRVVGRRPAFIFSHDQHSAWVSTRALELAGLTRRTPDPAGGVIERDPDGSPRGLLREIPGYDPVFRLIPAPSRPLLDRLYGRALAQAYRRGVTGVHSFDGPAGFAWFIERAARGALGLRINYYAPAPGLPELRAAGTRYGAGDDFLRVAGIKIFADGSLGSRTALCYQPYRDDRRNRGVEVTPPGKIASLARAAARLGLPCAIHAIGDRAVANVLDALAAAPPLRPPARHRIEHLQLVRRRDLPRLKKLNIVASVQPQQTVSDIEMVRAAWGGRAKDAYIFRALLDLGIDLAFGSDVPIEPLDPLAGIAAAVRRAHGPGEAFPDSGPAGKRARRGAGRDVFHPEQRITAAEALFAFTAGPAIAAGQAECRGRLLPGYPADFVILSQDPTRVAPLRPADTEILATVLDGKVKYTAQGFSL